MKTILDVKTIRGAKWPTNAQGFTLVELMFGIAVVAVLTSIAVPVSQDYRYKAQVVRAIAEVRTVEREINLFESDMDRFPNSLDEIGRGSLLDPWRNPYQYLNIADAMKGKSKGITKGKHRAEKRGGGHPKGARKDKHEVPLNDDYDLYSKGKDGISKAPLQNPFSHDDVVRANNGEYVGLASEY